mmetsp:Transcript_98395/g.283956  ORF Transcript_98395/g.283956 Transcript_98395/m.283956 type:complete len:251 (-) Transcript_98395:97-849(-)
MLLCASLRSTKTMAMFCKVPCNTVASAMPMSLSSALLVLDSQTGGLADKKVIRPPNVVKREMAPGMGPVGNFGPPVPNAPTQTVMSMSDSTWMGRASILEASSRKWSRSEDTNWGREIAAKVDKRSWPVPAVSISVFNSCRSAPVDVVSNLAMNSSERYRRCRGHFDSNNCDTKAPIIRLRGSGRKSACFAHNACNASMTAGSSPDKSAANGACMTNSFNPATLAAARFAGAGLGGRAEDDADGHAPACG